AASSALSSRCGSDRRYRRRAELYTGEDRTSALGDGDGLGGLCLSSVAFRRANRNHRGGHFCLLSNVYSYHWTNSYGDAFHVFPVRDVPTHAAVPGARGRM